MYHRHFGFTVKPFQINADPRFLWLGEKHTEALSILRYGVLENRGFLLLTGDVGTGKTTLLNALLQDLDENVLVARIPDPKLDVIDFYNILADSLGMNETFESRGPFLQRFESFLNQQHYQGKTVLLIIDEAQRLDYELLEEIRALSNLEKPEAKLLNVFFIGQDEFNDMLLDYRSRAISQRITLSYHLEPLDRGEVAEYIWHRQKVAGAKKSLFSKRAIDFIHKFSGGFPRLINIICDHALLTAYTQDKRFVSDTIASECARDLEVRSFNRQAKKPEGHEIYAIPAAESEPEPDPEPQRPVRTKRRTALAAAGLFLFFLLSSYAGYLWIPGAQGILLRMMPPENTATTAERPSADIAIPPLITGTRPSPPPRAPAPRAENESKSISSDTASKTRSGNEAAQENAVTEANIEEKDIGVLDQDQPSVEAVPPASAFEHPRTERGGGDKDRSSRDGAEAASARASTPPDAPGSPERSNPRSNIKKEATEDAVPAATSSAAATSEPDTDSSRFSPAPGFEKLVVYFLHDEYGLDGRSLETLSYAKQLLRRNPDLRATVTGYTDTMGERRYNVELSRQRAEIVKGYLSGKNIAEERIKARGLGPRNPIASNETLEGRAQNRRVEIVLGYPSE